MVLNVIEIVNINRIDEATIKNFAKIMEKNKNIEEANSHISTPP